jgi:ATP-dependent RNA helicase DHX36
VANIDEWRWKLNMLQRNAEEQEIISRDRRDRRDYDQIANLAKRMGLYRFCTVILLITPASEFSTQPLKYQCIFAAPLLPLWDDSELYGRVIVASKVPLPNYRPDLDDKRPQREVSPCNLMARSSILL